MHKSTTNLVDRDDEYYEDEEDDIKIMKRQAADHNQQQQQQQQQIDDDSMRRHEIDRGSEIEYDKRAQQKYSTTQDGRINNRDQLFIKDGNAEILQLITRGKVDDENVYVNVPQQQQQQQQSSNQQPQFIMFDNGGKEILMRRFIEEQTNGKHIIREHYQIIPSAMHTAAIPIHQPIPNEVMQNATDAYTIKSGSAIYSNNNNNHLDKNMAEQQMQPAISSQSLIQQELETSLKQQNALLRQILLEKEKLEEKYSSQEVAMETQSLPGHSLAIATQTDCDAGTQTEPYNIRPEPRRARSENDDSSSEAEYEYVRYSPLAASSPDGGEYWIKRKRHRTRRIAATQRHPQQSHRRRRIVMVEEVKRKIRTPIKEELEEHQTPTKRPNYSHNTHVIKRKTKPSSKQNSANLSEKILGKISDSLMDDHQDGRRRSSTHSKNIEYYLESDVESDEDIVIRSNSFESVGDAVDEQYEFQPYTPRTKSRHYDVLKNRRSGSVSSIPIHPAAAAADAHPDDYDDAPHGVKPKRKTTSEPSANNRSQKRQAPRPPSEPERKSVRSKAQSDEDIYRKLRDEQSFEMPKHVPKYMEWYYGSKEPFRVERKPVVNKKAVGATERKIKAKAPQVEGKLKPKPMARNLPVNNGDASGMRDGGGGGGGGLNSNMLREDVQMNKSLAPKQPIDANHSLLQYSEHRFEHEYDAANDIHVPPSKLPHYIYPEQKQQQPPQPTTKVSQRPKQSPIHENEVKEKSNSKSTTKGTAKQLNAATLEDDHDSGIAMNSLLHNMGRRNPIVDKKSVFTIAYDDVKVSRIHQSESDSPQL